MKKKIMVMMCSFLLAMPFLSFAEEKKEPDPNVSAYEHAHENAKFKRNRDAFNKRANKKIRAKKLAEKEASESKKKAEEEAHDRGERQDKKKEHDPNVSAYEHADENAKFKRGGEVFNNKANRKNRAKKRAEKETEKTKKKTEEMQDKGEGQVNVNF